jgi:hypothetical protein
MLHIGLLVKLPKNLRVRLHFMLRWALGVASGGEMAELLIRAGAADAALLERIFDGSGRAQQRWLPDRIVVDAHVAAVTPRIAATARHAGVPLVIDPQTYYLQDSQHAADPWAALPFADPTAYAPADLSASTRQDRLVADCLEYQLAGGATMLIAPYLHVEQPDDGWALVQAGLWRSTRRYLDQQGMRLPVIAVMALGWRVLERHTWSAVLWPLRRALRELTPDEVALAASKVDSGAHPDERLVTLEATIRALTPHFPVIAWNQGTLGEAAVAAGASGYETGIGWRERCDLRARMGDRRAPGDLGGGPRPVYIEALKRSIPKTSVESLLAHARIGPELVCLDLGCCPGGRRDLLHDMRHHAIVRRARALHDLSSTARTTWRWSQLATGAAAGLAARINGAAEAAPALSRIDTAALSAIHTVADSRRQGGRRRSAA